MKTLQGIKIDKFPLDNLFKIGDLVNYDGPLLSLFSNSQRELYLYDWVDSDKYTHRWLIYRVTSSQLRAYLKRRLTHYELITSTPSVLLVDLDSKIEPQNIILLTTKNLPADYLPEKEVLHDDDESPHLTQIQRYLDELEFSSDLEKRHIFSDETAGNNRQRFSSGLHISEWQLRRKSLA